MWKKILLGMVVPALALTVFGFVSGPGTAPEARVICCGECKPGDDCLAKCEVVGKVPKDTKVTCCGHCQKGDNCLEKCGAQKSCCETK